MLNCDLVLSDGRDINLSPSDNNLYYFKIRIDLIKTNHRTRRTHIYFPELQPNSWLKNKVVCDQIYILALSQSDDTIARNFKYPLHLKRTIYFTTLL